jgi:hypothetical protein
MLAFATLLLLTVLRCSSSPSPSPPVPPVRTLSVPIVNDDVNDGRVKTSVCKTAIFNLCHVQAGSALHLNETIACLFQQIDWLDNESTCAMYLNSVVANMVDTCSEDQGTLCTGEGDSETPTKLLTCLASRYYTVSKPCAGSIDLLLGNIVPCAAEVSVHCPTLTEPTDVMPCLAAASGADDFSAACAAAVQKYAETPVAAAGDDADASGDWNEENHADDGEASSDGESGSGSGSGSGNGSGKKSKDRYKVENDDAKTPFEDTEDEDVVEESYFTIVAGLGILVTLLAVHRCYRMCCATAQADVNFVGTAKGTYVRAPGEEDEDEAPSSRHSRDEELFVRPTNLLSRDAIAV